MTVGKRAGRRRSVTFPPPHSIWSDGCLTWGSKASVFCRKDCSAQPSIRFVVYENRTATIGWIITVKTVCRGEKAFPQGGRAAAVPELCRRWVDLTAKRTRRRQATGPIAVGDVCRGEQMFAVGTSNFSQFLGCNLFSRDHWHYVPRRDESPNAGGQTNHEQHHADLEQVALA